MLIAMKRRWKQIALAVAIVLVVVGYSLLLWRGPWWIDGAHLRSKNLEPADGVVITGFRTMLVALGAGAVAAFGLYYTHKGHKQTEALFEHTREKDREQAVLTREGQVTERYVAAIKLLASKDLMERLGGIHSLERIMRDSARDHGTVVDVLAAYVRHHAQKTGAPQYGTPPPEDVRAAMIVIGRRPKRDELFPLNLAGVQLHLAELKRANLSGTTLDYALLSAADLEGTDLTKVHLQAAVLSAATLSNATLAYAEMREAKLNKTNLTNSDLSHADLTGVDLTSARMQFANLSGAKLRRAVLDKTEMAQVILKGTDLCGVDLRETLSLSLEGLCEAILDTHTQLPSGLAAHPKIQARLAECGRSLRARAPDV
jgi:uncharacterized protein YjbI with pentapeptide repeats